MVRGHGDQARIDCSSMYGHGKEKSGVIRQATPASPSLPPQEMGPLFPSKQESLLNSPNFMALFADRPQALLPLECRVSLSRLIAMTKCLAKQLTGRRTCLVSQFEGRAHHWGPAWSHWSHRLPSQQAERGECCLLSGLLPSLPLI